ncbi:MAG: SDR family oxidoreductase [Rickettsiales bacterium]|jgi:NAD(P)-dependent dehydrogenase (short-subunit alcohol dehydrogenase family)|nr:SDR family oxidoreductase [Rickettsiales bacterium]
MTTVKTAHDGLDRYYMANSGDASVVADKQRSNGAEYIRIAGDITDEQSISSIFDSAAERFGKVDILVNNAAHSDDNDTIETVTLDAIETTFGTNARIDEPVKKAKEYYSLLGIICPEVILR